MSGESVVAYVSAGAAVLAAGAAFWQAGEARRSARNAAGNERLAGEAAQRAAGAGVRAADALEALTELHRRSSERPRWAARATAKQTTDVIRVTNYGEKAFDVTAVLVGIDAKLQNSRTFPAVGFDSGAKGTVMLHRVWGLAADRLLEITWRDEPGGEVRVERMSV